MSLLREALLADVTRALQAKSGPEGADPLLRELERSLAGDSLAWNRSTAAASAALRACFPDRGVALASELRMTVALSRLDRWLAESRPALHYALRPAAREADFAPLEKAAGLLPVAFRLLYGWHDGQGTVRGDAPLFRGCSFLSLKSSLTRLRKIPGRRRWVPFLGEGKREVWCVDREGSFEGTTNQVLCADLRSGLRTIAFPDLETFLEVWTESLEANMWDVSDAQPFDERAWVRFAAERAPGYPRRHAEAGEEDAQDR